MNFSTKKLFSSRDDAHLVEYLSDFDAGRKGTRLYRDLVDNPTQWPWSSRHPWQSWRDRYVRKSDDFERMIRFHKNKARLVETAPALTSSEPHLLNSKRKADLEPEDTRQEKRPRINAEQSSNSTKRALPSSQTAAGPSGTQDKSFPLLTPAEALNIVSKLRFVQIDTSKSHRKPTISSDKGEGSSRANAPTRRRPLWKKPWITPVPESTILDLDQPLVSQRSQTSNGDFRNRPSPERAAPPRTEGLSHAVESNQTTTRVVSSWVMKTILLCLFIRLLPMSITFPLPFHLVQMTPGFRLLINTS
ncbi:hypothetical protein BDP27DRAFT_328926 [Rhodocollybia butyracea]|uniref:TERF2-interacting telomeric protein 1 Myb domain-containing protein n=1 Tax=Rhodocollybia butyracea TaxID=206335 RepID=A0A9P5Q987_9AGAR|nr:hypothetical protein BDP27DRAFT_328926 [Rhodocollybia butyracea]